MRSAIRAAAVVALAAPVAHALAPRSQITSDSYDFVVVGGGQAGLVLGRRLSENTNYTVLVLEAGTNGDEYRERIDTPAYSYYDSLWTTPLNWAFSTVPQPNAGDREIFWPRGKTLGGSSAINGLYLTRPGKDEINAWMDMLGDMDGADYWGWDSFYSALKKSETFTPPGDSIAAEANITWDASTHGTDGPIHASYPGYTFSQVGQWIMSLGTVGIASSSEMYGGANYGAELSTSTINPTNWTRSYSRTGYLDPLPDSGNYDVLTDAYVTRLVFKNPSSKGNLTASAVEYTCDGGKTNQTVQINKEVILTAGAVGSPAILLYSGVGPKDVLLDAGVDLVSELPGVGQHVQDHFSATVKWTTNVETSGSIYYDDGADKNDTLYLSYIDSAIAYVNASALFGDEVESFQQSILSNITSYSPNTTYDAGVVAGYEAICNITANTILNSTVGQIEILYMNSDANGDVGITAALQHPYSHGRIYINSSNPLDYPVIDPNYLAHPADLDILLKGIKLVRRIGESSPLKSTLIKETTPGSDVKTDDDWLDWLRQSASTEFHPSSSCAMLPQDQGGVVDANLRVYGLANVRVADASVAPFALATHLMSSTYAIAEQASDIILKTYNTTSPSPTVPHLSTSSTAVPDHTPSPTSTRASAASDSRQSPAALWYLGASLAVVFSLLF